MGSQLHVQAVHQSCRCYHSQAMKDETNQMLNPEE